MEYIGSDKLRIKRNYKELNKKFKIYKLKQELESEKRKKELEWFKKFGTLEDELPKITQNENLANYVKGFGGKSITIEEIIERTKLARTLKYKRNNRKVLRKKIEQRIRAKIMKEIRQSLGYNQ